MLNILILFLEIYGIMVLMQQIEQWSQNKGIEAEDIKIIRNPVEVQKLACELIKSAHDEILIIFSTANAFYRQEKAGTIKLLI